MHYEDPTLEEARLVGLVVNPKMVDIPARRIGQWEIVHTGKHTCLMHDERGMVMSNEDYEIHAAARFAATATGCVVVLGLGLGLVVRMLLARAEVSRIAVVEIDNEVIDLVGDTFQADRRVTIREGDAFSSQCVRKHRRKYSDATAIWADIWDAADANSYGQRLALTARWAGVAPRIDCWGMGRSVAHWEALRDAGKNPRLRPPRG